MSRSLNLLAAVLCLSTGLAAQTPHTLTVSPGKTITLKLPDALDINIAASGLHRVRFFAKAPDGRVFVTGMYNLADNTQGSVFILDGWDEKTQTFTKVVHYLDHLRNPNNLAFWTDPATHQSWLYLPLTNKLVRYKYNAGDNAPTSKPETLMRFPEYGLSYKYGGWHLTRTVAIAALRGATRVYVSSGSSCNYCQEHEVARAAVISMDPDGKHQQLAAQGLRNAVDMRYIDSIDGGALFASNMGDDHLGDKLPEDTFFELDSNARRGPLARLLGLHGALPPPTNYGWPTCYFANGKPVHDSTPFPVAASSPNAVAPLPPAAMKEKAQDSVYGAQAGVAATGTNLAAGGGHTDMPDPNANLGTAPEPLASCEHVPPAYTTFAAHSSPLGLEYFADDKILRGDFLVALHGASKPHIGTGYRVAQFTQQDRTPRDFITGFLTFVNGKPVVHGRPCGILRIAPDTFLMTDDYLGLVYYIHPKT
jgi:glucose/arabinose dehydrogenase